MTIQAKRMLFLTAGALATLPMMLPRKQESIPTKSDLKKNEWKARKKRNKNAKAARKRNRS